MPAVTPRVVLEEGRPQVVVLPWDPGYASLPGEGTPLDPAPAHLAVLPSRLTFESRR